MFPLACMAFGPVTEKPVIPFTFPLEIPVFQNLSYLIVRKYHVPDVVNKIHDLKNN